MLHCYTCFQLIGLHVLYSCSTYIYCLWSNIIRKHVHLNGWLMRYGQMQWTLFFLMKCLGCFTWKKYSLTISSVMIYSYQSHMLFTLKTSHICCLLLHWALSNCCDPSERLFMLSWSRSRTLHLHKLNIYTGS
jgi:hypothetical protein